MAKKKSKSSRRWLERQQNDEFTVKAKQEGYRSRAVYKLLEIHEKNNLFTKGMTVIDLGAAPGGWSQVAANLVGAKGRVIAADILPMEPIIGVDIIEGDFREEDVFNKILTLVDKDRDVDLVISDLAPNFSGISAVDLPRSIYLAEIALDLAKRVLKPKGSLLVKLFQGEGFDNYLAALRQDFRKVTVRKPKASRSASAEMYALAMDMKFTPLTL